MPTEPTGTILATPSTSESALSEMPPRITITLNELARALDQMGSTEPVLATTLYHTLLQLQSLPPTAGAPTTIQSKPNHDVYANKQYTMSSSSAANSLLWTAQKTGVLLFNLVRQNPAQKFSAIKRYDVGCWKWRRLRFPTASHLHM
jgi:hypothetical protein